MSSRLRWGGLRAKIIAWSFVPTAIILFAVALVTFYAYQRVTQDLVIERNRELARLSASQLATEMTEYTNALSALTRLSEVQWGGPATRREALRGASNRLVAFDAGVALLDTYGTVVATEPERPELLGQDWSSLAYFRQMVRFPSPTFSSVLSHVNRDTPIIAVAVPILGSQSEFLGAAVGMFRLGAATVSSFYGSIVKLRLGTDGGAYLVDGSGRVIYHADAERIGDDFSALPAVQQVVEGKVGALRTRDLAGRDIVASFAPVPGTPWGLVTEVRWETLLKPSQGYRQFLFLLLALGVIIPAMVVAFGVRRITRPITELIGAAQEVANGRLGQTITATTGDELEELVKQFNLMSAQLLESYTALQEREERLGLVIQGTNDGIWDWDLRSNTVHFSPRWKGMLGYEDHEISNRFDEWQQRLHPEDVGQALAEVRDYLEGRKPVYQLEHRLRHKDGTYRWILARGIALRDAQGKPYRMAGSHTDVTERKQAERALQERLSFEKLI